MIIDIHEFLFPILGGEQIEETFEPKNILGTASLLYDDIFITAGHTLKNAITYKKAAIGLYDSTTNEASYEIVSDINILEDIDLATFKINISPHKKSFRIETSNLDMLSDVIAAGFPHGLDLKNKMLRNRSFKGYIVSNGPFMEFPKKPDCYELSFPCPKGISGAPLLQFDSQSNEFLIKGYIIGSSNCEITVFSEIEKTEEGKLKTIYEKTESLKFGIAINITEVLKIINIPDSIIKN